MGRDRLLLYIENTEGGGNLQRQYIASVSERPAVIGSNCESPDNAE